MAGCDVEPKQVLREIDVLVNDFKTLRLASAKGAVRTDREAMLSLTPIPKPAASSIRLARRNFKPHPSNWVSGRGVELGDVQPSTYTEMESAPIHYARQTGVPIVNSVGESLVLNSGWSSWHSIHLSGDHAEESRGVIERANAWVRERRSIIRRALFYGRHATFNDFCWPDIVLMIGERPDADATMTKPKWSVEIGWVYFNPDADGNPRLSPSFERMVQSVSVEMWKKRKAEDWQCFGRCEPFASITEADELFIGDPPEVMYCEQELKPFLRDSELALDWLRRWIEDSMSDAIPSEPIPSAESKQSVDPGDDSIHLAAFRAVIDGGLAGVLRASEKAPSHAKVSEEMRNMLTADEARYAWSADDWVRELGCSKPTIIGNKKRGVPPCDAWSEIMAWRASNKQSRFPKKL